jgi:alpha-beta hydrolase superfamily lysophospholipase
MRSPCHPVDSTPCHEGSFTAADGCQLWERRWLPDRPASAVVVVVHGFVEHSGRYGDLAAALQQQGWAVYTQDLRGHGRSGGDRVWIDSFDRYLDDLKTFVDRVRQREGDKPLFLFGHSMGGAIVLRFGLLHPEGLRGVIASGPSLRVGQRVFPLLRRLAMLFSLLVPRLRVVRMGGRMLSRDQAVVDDFRNDPLVYHDRFPVRTGAEIIRAGRQMEIQAGSFQLPLLVLHGTGDVVTDPEGSRWLYAHIGSRDKALKFYEGVYHDLLHEPERSQVTADLIQWIGARLGD